MKKVLLATIISSLVTASVSMAGLVTWGSITIDPENGPVLAPFTDNNANTFTGYAYLFLLQSQSQTVSWDANTTSWNLNSAQQISYSAAGTLMGTPGTWGDMGTDGAVADNKWFADSYYQVVLTTTPGSATLAGVGVGGYYATTTAKTPDSYDNGFEGVNKSGLIVWNSSSSWAPVAAVPEPATMALFGLGGLALVIRRKMRKEA